VPNPGGWSLHATRALRAGHSPRNPTRRFFVAYFSQEFTPPVITGCPPAPIPSGALLYQKAQRKQTAESHRPAEKEITMKMLDITTPVDLISLIGNSLDYWPQGSLVCIALQGPHHSHPAAGSWVSSPNSPVRRD
jgi:hypothetical protein